MGPIPERFFSPAWAAVTGLAIGGVVFGVNEARAWMADRAPPPAQAPMCYDSEWHAYAPGTDSLPRDPSQLERLNLNRHDDGALEKIATASVECTAQACSKEALKTYRSAFFWYLADRLTLTRNLDMAYGDEGLRRAATMYSSAADEEAVAGLRERFQSGVIRLKNFRQQQEAVEMLVVEDRPRELIPCRGDLSTAEPLIDSRTGKYVN